MEKVDVQSSLSGRGFPVDVSSLIAVGELAYVSELQSNAGHPGHIAAEPRLEGMRSKHRSQLFRTRVRAQGDRGFDSYLMDERGCQVPSLYYAAADRPSSPSVADHPPSNAFFRSRINKDRSRRFDQLGACWYVDQKADFEIARSAGNIKSNLDFVAFENLVAAHKWSPAQIRPGPTQDERGKQNHSEGCRNVERLGPSESKREYHGTARHEGVRKQAARSEGGQESLSSSAAEGVGTLCTDSRTACSVPRS
jgi:hypothetical protein